MQRQTTQPSPPPVTEDMRDFLMVIRRAILMVNEWIERRLDLPNDERRKRHART